MTKTIEQLRARNAELEKEVAHWKNNHETEVRRARILKERTDMPIDRVRAYEKWGEDQRRIVELENDAKERQSDHAALVEENHELRKQLAIAERIANLLIVAATWQKARLHLITCH